MMGARAGQRSPPSAHHLVGRSVLVGFVQVTLAIVGLDQATQFSVQCDVGHIVRCEHQQVQCVFSPSDLLLKDRRRGWGGRKWRWYSLPIQTCPGHHTRQQEAAGLQV